MRTRILRSTKRSRMERSKIVSTSQKLKRTRTATSEHAEYYADDGKVVMTGGEPKLVDNVKGKPSRPNN